jgi:biopolymer transport protein ExbD
MKEQGEPIALRREQFGLVAVIVLLCAWIPHLISMPQLIHIVKIDFGDEHPFGQSRLLRVAILENGQVNVDGIPARLQDLADQMAVAKSQSRPVHFHPDGCAPYATVLQTIAVMKRSMHPDVRFAPPDYPTKFGKSALSPNQRGRPEYVLWATALPNTSTDPWNLRPILSVGFTDGCRTKADPERTQAPVV